MGKRKSKTSKPRCQAVQVSKISTDEACERLATDEELKSIDFIDIRPGLVPIARADRTTALPSEGRSNG